MSEQKPRKRLKRRRSLLTTPAPKLAESASQPAAPPPAPAVAKRPAQRTSSRNRIKRRRSLFSKKHVSVERPDEDLIAAKVIPGAESVSDPISVEPLQQNAQPPAKNRGLRRTAGSTKKNTTMDDFASELDAFLALDEF